MGSQQRGQSSRKRRITILPEKDEDSVSISYVCRNLEPPCAQVDLFVDLNHFSGEGSTKIRKGRTDEGLKGYDGDEKAGTLVLREVKGHTRIIRERSSRKGRK